MKLIELMLSAGVRWPVGATHAAQDADGEQFWYTQRPKYVGASWDGAANVPAPCEDMQSVSDDHDTHAVTREEYQEAGGWMLWEGGECPVEYGTQVDVKYRNGQNTEHVEAGVSDSKTGSRGGLWATNWEHVDGQHDIVGYRLSVGNVIPVTKHVLSLHKVTGTVIERIAEAANIQLPEDADIDTLCDALRQMTAACEHNSTIVNLVAETLGVEPEYITLRLDSVLSQLPKASAAPDSRTAVKRLRGLHTIYHGGELYRDSTILLQTDQTLVWRCEGSEFICKPAQALIDPDDNGLAAAIIARLSGADVAPEHIAEMREQMGWA